MAWSDGLVRRPGPTAWSDSLANIGAMAWCDGLVRWPGAMAWCDGLAHIGSDGMARRPWTPDQGPAPYVWRLKRQASRAMVNWTERAGEHQASTRRAPGEHQASEHQASEHQASEHQARKNPLEINPAGLYFSFVGCH